MSAIDFTRFFGGALPPLAGDRRRAIAGDELARLAAPLGAEVFAARFGAETLHLPGPADRFADLFDLDALRAALVRGYREPGPHWSVHASFQRGRAGGVDRAIDATYDQIGPLLDAGATLCVTAIHQSDPALASFCRGLKAQLGFTGAIGMNCYLSNDGAGYNTHYDGKISTSIQIAGAKRWSYAPRAAVRFPRVAARTRGDRVIHDYPGVAPRHDWEVVSPAEPGELQEILLTPGHVLSVPAGAWHAARAEGYSLALNLYAEQHSFFETVARILGPRLDRDPAWRGGAPVSAEPPDGLPPDSVRAYMRERIAELRAAVDALDPDDPELWAAWLAATVASELPASATATATALSPETRLRATADRPLRYTVARGGDGQLAAVVVGDNRQVRLPGAALPMVREICSGRPFRARDAATWSAGADHSWPAVRSVLQQLIDHQLIEVTP